MRDPKDGFKACATQKFLTTASTRKNYLTVGAKDIERHMKSCFNYKGWALRLLIAFVSWALVGGRVFR